MILRAVTLAFLALLFSGVTSTTAAAAPAEETGCPEEMKCSKVAVPLDWSGQREGSLNLDLAESEGEGPVLLFLMGGPGQSGLPAVGYVTSAFRSLAPSYRVAVLDQRGTGNTAIKCDRIQRLPLTDLTVRPRAAVQACGKRLGHRRAFYSTTSTVRDIEAVRRSIGVQKMAVMGTSYGTYVGIRYARAFPNRVSRLILDSVVPQEDVDPFMRVHMRRAGKVLRWECGRGQCGFRSDPAADLARLVSKLPHRGRLPGADQAMRIDGPVLLDWVTTLFSFAPTDIPRFGLAIHRASRGNYRPLMKVGAKAVKLAQVESAEDLSWGLHAATICSDVRFPYSIGSGNRKSRVTASRRALRKSPGRAFWPFNRSTGLGNGLSQVCLDWQPTKVKAPPKPGRISQPTLFLAGQYDISTPLAYAKREMRRAPKGKLVVVPEVGHAAAFSKRCSARAVAAFLRKNLRNDPCRKP